MVCTIQFLYGGTFVYTPYTPGSPQLLPQITMPAAEYLTLLSKAQFSGAPPSCWNKITIEIGNNDQLQDIQGESPRTASIVCGKSMNGKNMKFWQFTKVDGGSSTKIFFQNSI